MRRKTRHAQVQVSLYEKAMALLYPIVRISHTKHVHNFVKYLEAYGIYIYVVYVVYIGHLLCMS